MTPRPGMTMPDLVNRRAKMHYVTALNELARIGVDFSRIDILAVGTHQNYRGEVRRQEPSPGTELGPDTAVRLEIGASSAVDVMPYQFFLGYEHSGVAGQEWERRARCLMAPFDAAVIRHDSLSLYKILKLSFGYLDRGQLENFCTVFDIKLPEAKLSDRELLLLAMLLPAVHEWAGNADLVAAALELMFRCRFEIEESIPRRYQIPPHLRYRLGDTGLRLGRDTLVGSSFVECDSAYRVTMRGLSSKRVPAFLPGRPERKKLEWFLNLVMPNNLVWDLQVVPRQRQSRLGGEHREAFLGYGSYV